MPTHRYDSFNHLLYDRVPSGARVLDVGCATGRLCEKLEAEKHCTCFGIESNAEAALLARSRCSGRVDVVDLDDNASVSALSYDDKFDCLVFADVLEHLKRPGPILRLLSAHLVQGGLVLSSIPNIAFWRKRLMLLRGAWEYEDVGICDATHLRFYTERTARALYRESGLKVTRLDYGGIEGRYGLIKRFWPRLFAGGFVIEARPDETTAPA